MIPVQMLIIVLALIVEAFWVVQFIDLMSRKDDEFPGRFDKPAWVFALVITNVVGAIVFFACAKWMNSPFTKNFRSISQLVAIGFLI